MDNIQETKEALIERLLKQRLENFDSNLSLMVDCDGGHCGCGSVKDESCES